MPVVDDWMSDDVKWCECQTPEEWDKSLATFGGHPLQSALWGNTRSKVDGIPQLLLRLKTETGKANGLARVEERSIPCLGKIAWLPKGPVLSNDQAEKGKVFLLAELKRRGFIVCISDHYAASQISNHKLPKTIWIDLTVGLDILSKNLDSQWRYGAKRALREGVIVRKTTNPTEISKFFQLCKTLSLTKGFALPGSEKLILELIQSTQTNRGVGMSLYVGDVKGVIAGGVVVAEAGRHLHYFWGVSDRNFSKYRVSEAIHWQIIQEGVASGKIRYDLEGIDPVGNPGVYQFKRKMGGTEVFLHGIEAVPLSWAGKVVVSIGRLFRRFG